MRPVSSSRVLSRETIRRRSETPQVAREQHRSERDRRVLLRLLALIAALLPAAKVLPAQEQVAVEWQCAPTAVCFAAAPVSGPPVSAPPSIGPSHLPAPRGAGFGARGLLGDADPLPLIDQSMIVVGGQQRMLPPFPELPPPPAIPGPSLLRMAGITGTERPITSPQPRTAAVFPLGMDESGPSGTAVSRHDAVDQASSVELTPAAGEAGNETDSDASGIAEVATTDPGDADPTAGSTAGSTEVAAASPVEGPETGVAETARLPIATGLIVDPATGLGFPPDAGETVPGGPLAPAAARGPGSTGTGRPTGTGAATGAGMRFTAGYAPHGELATGLDLVRTFPAADLTFAGIVSLADSWLGTAGPLTTLATTSSLRGSRVRVAATTVARIDDQAEIDATARAALFSNAIGRFAVSTTVGVRGAGGDPVTVAAGLVAATRLSLLPFSSGASIVTEATGTLAGWSGAADSAAAVAIDGAAAGVPTGIVTTAAGMRAAGTLTIGVDLAPILPGTLVLVGAGAEAMSGNRIVAHPAAALRVTAGPLRIELAAGPDLEPSSVALAVGGDRAGLTQLGVAASSAVARPSGRVAVALLELDISNRTSIRLTGDYRNGSWWQLDPAWDDTGFSSSWLSVAGKRVDFAVVGRRLAGVTTVSTGAWLRLFAGLEVGGAAGFLRIDTATKVGRLGMTTLLSAAGTDGTIGPSSAAAIVEAAANVGTEAIGGLPLAAQQGAAGATLTAAPTGTGGLVSIRYAPPGDHFTAEASVGIRFPQWQIQPYLRVFRSIAIMGARS